MDNILYFDIESTGLALHKARIVSISFILGEKYKTFLVNPGIPIPYESSRIHGIYDKDVEDCKPLSYYKDDILKILNMCDTYSGYNIKSYDINLLKIEMLRCGIEIPDKPIIDIYELTSSLFRSLKLKDIFLTLTGKTFQAHNSLSDIKATKDLHEIIMERFLKNNNQIDNR
jgi:DNA polymerase-3 subunit epsilon